MSHGRDEAVRAYQGMVSQFGSSDPDAKIRTSSDISEIGADAGADLPTVTLPGPRCRRKNSGS